jgi:uncharacterized oligopeptide transporter (OPT) family protein
MPWFSFVLDHPGAVLGSVMIVLWGFVAAAIVSHGSDLMQDAAVVIFYWITQVIVLLAHYSERDFNGPYCLGFLIGDLVFLCVIVWHGLLSPEARKSRRQEQKRQAAIAAIAARGGFTDPRRNRQPKRNSRVG